MKRTDGYAHGEFCWVDLAAHDMQAAGAFYGELFGWQVVVQDTRGGPPYAMLSTGAGVVGGLGELNDEMKAAGIPPVWNSYVNVDDADAIVARVVELGGEVTVPVMDVLDAGRLAFFRDPTGGHVAVWEKRAHRGAEIVNEPGSFCWNELATPDADGAAEFFSKLFGWDYAPNPGAPTTYHIVKNRGRDNGGIIQMSEAWGDMPAHWMVYFAVDDLDESLATVERLGGTVCVPPFEIPVGRLSVINDPQGGVVTLIRLTAALGER